MENNLKKMLEELEEFEEILLKYVSLAYTTDEITTNQYMLCFNYYVNKRHSKILETLTKTNISKEIYFNICLACDMIKLIEWRMKK